MAQLLMAKHAAVVEGSLEEGSSESFPSAVESETQQTQESNHDTPKPNGSSKSKFNLSSMDSFPSLSNSAPVSTVPTAWGPGIKSRSASPSVTPANTTSQNNNNNNKSWGFLNKVKSSVITENFTLPADAQVPNARSLLVDAIKSAKRASNAAIDSSTNRMGHTSFVLKGKPEEIAKAKRELMKSLAAKVTKTIQIPADLRALVIGTKGSTLRPIISKSGVSINIDSTPEADDVDEVDVVMEGDEEGIAIATSEILAIVSSRVREITAKIPVDDERYYPFLEAKSSLPSKHLEGYFAITGEQEAVANAKQELENYISRDLSRFTTVFVNDILNSKHALLNLDSYFESNGVIATGGKNRIELFGPKSKLDEIKKELIKKANDQSVLSLDISKAHDKSQSHAENLLAYFTATNKFQPIEKKHNVQIHVEGTICNIVGNSKDSIKSAKSEIVALVNKYGPGHVRLVSDVSTFFKSQILRIAAQQSTVGVIITPSEKVLLVYEGRGKANHGDSSNAANDSTSDDEEEDFAPGPQEIKEPLDAVDLSFDEIRELGKNLGEKILSVPKSEHKHILGPNGTTLKAIKGKENIIIELGTPRAGGEDAVYIYGVKSEVDRVAGEILEVIEEAKNYEKLSAYTTEFKFPIAHVPKLIGKKGANLTELREEYGVRIDIDEDGNGVIKGIKKNAEGAKAHIISMAKRFEDESSIKMKVPTEYHALLIGSGGRFVRRLREKYHVAIIFPEVGGDDITIRGPSRGVEKTREEFADLIKYEQEHSYQETLTVPSKFLARIIGRNGENINVVKDLTETKIDINDEKKGEKAEIVIVGTKAGVKEASSKINELVTQLSDIVEELVEVDSKYHSLLIGPGGSTRREIIEKAGGSFDDGIDVPPAGSDSTQVSVRGHRKVVQKIIKQIKDIVETQEKQKSVEIPIPLDQHGAIIGRGGLTKQEIEYEFNVSINIPRKGSKKPDGTADDLIKITGVDQKNIDDAVTRIKELTLQEKVVVPREYQEELANKGAFIRYLQSEYNVSVNVDENFQKNSRFSIEAPAEAYGEEKKAPADGSMNFKFTTYPLDKKVVDTKKGDATWKIKGEQANCKKARAMIEKTLETIKKHDHKGYLWFADSTRYKFVIGPQGRTINRIRNESGCTITVPTANTKEIIGLIGSSEQLEKAKQAILKAASA